MKKLIFLAVVAFSLARLNAQAPAPSPSNGGGGSGNATQVNGASVPASQTCLGSNSSSQITSGTCTGASPYTATLSYTGTPVTITALTHGKGSNPVVEVYDTWGITLATYYCTTSGGAQVGCADATSSGNVVIVPFKQNASASGGTAPYAYTVAIRN